MLEITRIATDNLKKTYYVQGMGKYLVCKFHDDNHYVIYKGTDKNLLSKEKFKTLDDALQDLHEMYWDMMPILKHNQQHLINMDFKY